MIISNTHKYVFVAIPKTGTRSIYKVLRENYDGFLYREHAKIIPDKYKSYFKFTVVRNPYDRLISMWWSTCKRLNKDKSKAGSNFKQLVASDGLIDLLDFMIKSDYNGKGSELFSKQSDYLKNTNFNNIIKFENINQEFNQLPFISNDITLPMLNSTRHKNNQTKNPRNPDYTYYFNDEIISKINQYYKQDFEILDYKQL